VLFTLQFWGQRLTDLFSPDGVMPLGVGFLTSKSAIRAPDLAKLQVYAALPRLPQ
jgi:hypothetical protein